MSNDLNLQAPWVGKSDWDYFGWKTEEEEAAEQLAYDEYIDRLIDERRDEKLFGKEIKENE